MFYSIRHLTHFRYSAPVSESIMEVRMHPRNEGLQRCTTFQLSVSPRVRVLSYRDHLLNVVHHFDAPSPHNQLAIIAESVVDVQKPVELPLALIDADWAELDQLVQAEDFWELLTPSHFAKPGELLLELAAALDVRRRGDPLTLLREINQGVYDWFQYTPKSTKVDSPIMDALESRAGVCQDFTHIMITLVRLVGVPCRYVSGYLYHGAGTRDRSSDGATHAWVEAFLPHLGWVGFDPTNNLIATDRHIRTAVGRDYNDVPPTRGVFKGSADSELTVSVRVNPSDRLTPEQEDLIFSDDWTTVLEREDDLRLIQQQQQQ